MCVVVFFWFVVFFSFFLKDSVGDFVNKKQNHFFLPKGTGIF